MVGEPFAPSWQGVSAADRFYWVRAVDQYGNVSPFAGPVELTIDHPTALLLE